MFDLEATLTLNSRAPTSCQSVASTAPSNKFGEILSIVLFKISW